MPNLSVFLRFSGIMLLVAIAGDKGYNGFEGKGIKVRWNIR